MGARDRKFTQDGQECLLPDELWKVVAYREEGSEALKVYGFIRLVAGNDLFAR